MSLTAGARLGRYEIRSKIGEGAMGEVYGAFDPKINREVAMKVLPAGLRMMRIGCGGSLSKTGPRSPSPWS